MEIEIRGNWAIWVEPEMSSLSPRVIALEPSMEEGKPEVTKKNMH